MQSHSARFSDAEIEDEDEELEDDEEDKEEEDCDDEEEEDEAIERPVVKGVIVGEAESVIVELEVEAVAMVVFAFLSTAESF